MTVNSHCVESFEVSNSDVGERGVAVNCEKSTTFPEHPVKLVGLAIKVLFQTSALIH